MVWQESRVGVRNTTNAPASLMKPETKKMLNVAFKSEEIEDVTMKDKCCWCVLVFDYHNAIFEMLKGKKKQISSLEVILRAYVSLWFLRPAKSDFLMVTSMRRKLLVWYLLSSKLTLLISPAELMNNPFVLMMILWLIYSVMYTGNDYKYLLYRSLP